MADMLATAADLRALLGETEETFPDEQANLILEVASGAIQAAAGQQLLAVDGDAFQLLGDTESWFTLPQRPVNDVSLVKVDGVTVTDYKRFGDRLWRRCGWAACSTEPSVVEGIYSHGFYDGDTRLGLARSATLAVAARTFANPAGATGLSIDDFSQQFSQSTNSDLSGLVPENLRKSLRRTYGARARFVSI